MGRSRDGTDKLVRGRKCSGSGGVDRCCAAHCRHRVAPWRGTILGHKRDWPACTIEEYRPDWPACTTRGCTTRGCTTRGRLGDNSLTRQRLTRQPGGCALVPSPPGIRAVGSPSVDGIREFLGERVRVRGPQRGGSSPRLPLTLTLSPKYFAIKDSQMGNVFREAFGEREQHKPSPQILRDQRQSNGQRLSRSIWGRGNNTNPLQNRDKE